MRPNYVQDHIIVGPGPLPEAYSRLHGNTLREFFTDPNGKSCWEGVKVDLSSSDIGPQVVRAYLSRQHFDDVEDSCPMGGPADRRCTQR